MTLWRESVAWPQQLPAAFGRPAVMPLAQPGRWVARPESCCLPRHADARHKPVGRGSSGLLLLTASFLYKAAFILNTHAFWEFLKKTGSEKKRNKTDVSVLHSGGFVVAAAINNKLLINAIIFVTSLDPLLLDVLPCGEGR